VETCGGEASEVVRAGQPPLETATVSYDPQLSAKLGGVEIAASEQRAILERLGFTVTPLPFGGGAGRGAGSAADNPHPNPSPEGEGLWTVTAPSWRPDIDGAADLVEEVVRVHGLDRVASVALPRVEGVA